MVDQKQLSLFWDYLIFYPEEDEDDFDGVHYGGIKGIQDNAPPSAKEAFAKYREEQKRAKKRGLKI
jgi:hypothetical protein